MENLIFSETTTIGIRRVEMERTILQKREIQKKDTPVGTAIVKACTLPDGNIRYYPEYENVAELAVKEISLVSVKHMTESGVIGQQRGETEDENRTCFWKAAQCVESIQPEY